MNIILYIFLGIMAASFAGMMGLKFMMRMNTKVFPSEEVVLSSEDNQKTALVLYQPTLHNSAKDITMALANKLHSLGYTTIINHPSSYIKYDVEQYDLLVFGSGVYGNNIANVLKAYMQNIDFRKKQTMIYVIGTDERDSIELSLLKDYAAASSKLAGIKVHPGDFKEIEQFVEDFCK